MSEKYKKTSKYINYAGHLLILASANTGCFSISVFVSLFCVPVGITSSAVGIKIFAFFAGIKESNSIIKKMKKSMIKQQFQEKISQILSKS